MPRLLALAVLITCGCGPQKRVDPCSPSGTGVVDPPIIMTVVGERVEVELLLPPAVFCPAGNPVATRVVTEVLDSQNQPVSHVNTDPTSSNTAGYSTRVSFTPAIAGVHYLSARFEPALGITSRQIQVVLERSGEPPWLRTTLGAVCDEVFPLEQTVFCRRGTQLSVMLDGGVLSTETITGVATAGSTGWLWTDTRLSQLVEVDGGLERTDYAMAVTRGAIAVTAERWIQGTGAQFVEVRASDAGPSERRWSVDAGFGPITGQGLALSDELVGWATPTRVCSARPLAPVRCVESTLQPLVGEGNALWLRGAESGAVAIARISPDGQPLVLFVPAQSMALTDARLSRPAFSWNGRLVAVRSDDLSFEAWRSPGLVARQSVTESFVVFQLASGETVIYRR